MLTAALGAATAAGLGACVSGGPTSGSPTHAVGAGSATGAQSAGDPAAGPGTGTTPGPAAASTAGPASGPGAGAAPAFRADRQPGIWGRVQPFAAFVALDLAPAARAFDVRRMMRIWSSDIERLMSGRAPLTDPEPELARHTAGLSVTVGVGARVVALVRGAAATPRWLGELPAYRIDQLEERWSGGDLLLQVCADSPTTVSHAVRRLTVGVSDLARVRWVQRGFREPLDTGEGLIGMRNLFGQVDGTVNPSDESLVFIDGQGPSWLRHGSSVVIRRIRMDLQGWERVDRLARENAVGRRLADGAPVTGGRERDTPDFAATDPLGLPVIDDSAHVRRAHAHSAAEHFLRRPYSYDEGAPDDPDAGLIFVTYQADPLAQFHPVQARLAERDLLNLWTTPIGSAVFAVLPGIGADEFLGAALLA